MSVQWKDCDFTFMSSFFCDESGGRGTGGAGAGQAGVGAVREGVEGLWKCRGPPVV